MNIFIKISAGSCMVLLLAVFCAPLIASACDFSQVTAVWSNQALQATAHITNPTSCPFQISLGSYKMFMQPHTNGDAWVSTQQFIGTSGVVTIDPNSSMDLSVPIASCKTQVDLWEGAAAQAIWFGMPGSIYQYEYTNADVCTTTTPTPTPTPNSTCTSWTYSDWSTCVSGNQTRTVITSSPSGCTGGSPIVSQSCSVTCYNDSDCSSHNIYVGSTFCQTGSSNSIYQNFRTFVCQNPGTTTSSCVAQTPDVAQVKTTCPTGQICSNGVCSANGFAIQTLAATNILTNSATLNGRLVGLGTDPSVSVWFQWGPSTAYGFETNHQTMTLAGPVNQSITSLTPNAVYHFRAVAQNGTGVVYGQDMSFTSGNTIFSAQVQSLPATNIQPNSATLNGQLLSLGGDTGATVWFQWGPTVSYGSQTSTQTMNITGMFSQTITGLSPNTTYNFRVAAQTTSGIIYGSNLSLTTNSNGNVNTTGLNISCYATPNPANIGQAVTFYCNVSGGSGSYTYNWTGAYSSTQPTFTTSFSNSGTQTENVTVTSGTQSAPATISLYINSNNNTCNQTPYQTCSGTYLTYFNSCGNQTSMTYCPNGCNGNACINYVNTCTQYSYQRCSGNYLYWYDSCGNVQSNSTYCPNGCSGNSCTNYNNNITAQTMPATNVTGNQATLNGYVYTGNNNNYNSCNISTWFQYGTSTSYGSQTTQQSQGYTGAFSQTVYNLYSGNTYHFRAVAQDCSGNVVYGQDVTAYNNNNTTTGTLYVSKTVRNLSNGSGFSTSTSANPGDVLMFMITLQNNSGQDIQNVVVRDLLPANLIYNNQLVVARTNNASTNYSGDIISSLNLNTISANQTVTVTYQAQVASAGNFAFGTTTLNNSVTTTSSSSNYIPIASASVIVNRTGVLGASSISTGLTNNFWLDSFFLPLMITLFGLWMWKSGMFFGLEKWLSDKKKTRRGFKSEKELQNRIAKIREANNF